MLPITPPRFELSNPHINKVININDLGDINLIGKRGLSEISIESFFPKQNYYFCKVTPLDPQDYIDMILKWKNSSKPIRLIITDTSINIAVSIEEFLYGVKDGSGDVYFTLNLREYRFLKTYSKEVKSIPNEYTVRSGDTLWSIAKKETGNGNNYKVIEESAGIKTTDIRAGYKIPLTSGSTKYESPVLFNFRNQLNQYNATKSVSRVGRGGSLVI
jgi:nucleoid-associated protein YgaU